MTTAGSIVIDLLMRTGSFETDTKRAERRASDMFATLEKNAVKFAAGFAIAGAAAGAAALAWTREMAQTGKELDRFATLSNSSAETFQRWAYGARTVGIEQEKLADIFKDVQDRVGDFITTGGGPMADFFENIAPKIGLTAEQFRNLSGPEALGLFVSSLEKAGLSQSEMIFYMEAMASDSSLLVPLLRDNAAGMAAMGDEAERLGAVMSNSTVAAAKELDQNLQRLTGMVGGFSTQLANQVLPTLNSFISELTTTASKSDDLKNSVDTLVMDTGLVRFLEAGMMGMARMADIAVFLARAVELVGTSFELAANNAKLGIDYVESLSPTTWFDDENDNQIAQGYANSKRLITKFSNDLVDIITYEGNRFEQAAKAAIDKARLDRQAVKLSSEPITLVDLTIDPDRSGLTQKWLKEYATDAEKLAAKLNEARLAFGGIIPPEVERRIRESFSKKSGKDNAPIVYQDIDQLLSSMGELTVVTESYALTHENAMGRVSEFTLEAARNIQNSLGDGLYNLLKGNFSDIGQAFGDMLTRMVADASAAQLAQAMFGNYSQTGQIGGILGNIATSFLAPSFDVAPGFDLDSQSYLNNPPTFSSIQRFAEGGFTGHGGKYEPAGIVHRGEYVLTKEATSRIGVGALDRMNKGYANGGLVGGGPAATGSGAPVVNLINNSSQPLTASQPKVSIDDMGRMVIEVMLADWRRNGPYAQQLRSPR